MRPTVEDLQNIWLLTYSRSSLIETDEFLKALETVAPRSVQHRALIDAAVAAYGRPFTQCRVARRRTVVPLKGIPPPPHLAEFHQDALNMRNTMIGHKDATPAQGYTATPNVVLVHINSKEFRLYTTTIGEMELPMRSALKELCAYFLKHCAEKLRSLTKAYYSEVMKNQPGKYELVISEPPADWITPFQPKRGADFRAANKSGP
jgi:hypothetical protein